MKISVIVPVYNVEAYVSAALDSVLAQTYANWECICVDDGSTDGSGRILDAYASRDARIKVIHQANAGVSAARNHGMDLATGDILTFLDSDDTYLPGALEMLASVQGESAAEVIRYQVNLVDSHDEDIRDGGSPRWSRIELGRGSESPLRHCSLGWASAIARRIADAVRWPRLTHCEDPLFILECMRLSRLNVSLENRLANYLIRPGSAAHSANLKIITATCRYLPMAYSACCRLQMSESSRKDTVDFLRGFLLGPLANCWKDLPRADRAAARRTVGEAWGIMSACTHMPLQTKDRIVCDFVLNLGATCSCTDMLRERGLVFETSPYDWVGRGGMRRRAEFIANGFAGFLDPSRLVHEEASDEDPRHAHYVDTESGIAFFHEFPHDRSVDEVFPEIREKYARRIGRFEAHLRQARRVLVVWVADPRDNEPISDEDIAYCRRKLLERYPQAEFVFRCFRCPKDMPVDRPKIACGDDYAIVEFDYRNYEMGADPWMIHTDLIVPYLEPFSARDYRPHAVRQAFLRKQREKEMARFHARSWLDWQLAKFQYKAFKHLEKRLKRKGVRID